MSFDLIQIQIWNITDAEWIVRFVMARLAIVKIRQKMELDTLDEEIKEMRLICNNTSTDCYPFIMDMSKRFESLEYQERLLTVNKFSFTSN